MDPALRGSAAHVFVGTLDDTVTVDAVDAHHLERVLRLRAGEIVSASDGAWRWRLYRWLGGGSVEAAGEVNADEPAEPEITVGFTPVKGERPEWVVQKLTELGVDRIVPLRSSRSVIRWDGERGQGQVERLRRVAREAAMQSRALRLPVIEEVQPVGSVAGGLAHFDGEPLSLLDPCVLIGPEGGWSDDELAGRRHVSLGPRVLRAETAAVSAGVLLSALRDQGSIAP